jgi:hypothetical protein
MYSRLTLKRSHIYWGIVVLVVALIASPFRAPIAQAVEYLLKNQPDVSVATSSGPVLHIINTGTDPNDMGTGLTGENQATSGPGWAFGLFGMTHASNQGVGFNGWAATGGTSGNAIGAKATADGQYNKAMLGIAYASSGDSVGVKGETHSGEGSGVEGVNLGSTGIGYGVKGINSTDGAGVIGVGDGVQSYGVQGSVEKTTGYGLYTENKIRAGQGCDGCGGSSSALAMNSSSETLNLGDVVALVGAIGSPIGGSRPILAVVKASQSNAYQVTGVARDKVTIRTREIRNPFCDPYDPEPMPTPGAPNTNLGTLKQEWQRRQAYCAEHPTMTDTRVLPSSDPISPDSYLFVVTNGLAYVRVQGPVTPGQLLVPSSVPGVATAASAAPAQGTVLGKVAGPPDPGTGLVPVFVTLR